MQSGANFKYKVVKLSSQCICLRMIYQRNEVFVLFGFSRFSGRNFIIHDIERK